MMPLDVSEPEEIRDRLRSYLLSLCVAQELSESWVERASEGAVQAGQAFVRLQECMAAHVAGNARGTQDETGCAALWRLSAWLHADAQALASLPLEPPLTRQSMASERVQP